MGIKTTQNRRQLLNRITGGTGKARVFRQPYEDGSESHKHVYPDGHVEYTYIDADGKVYEGAELPRGLKWSDGSFEEEITEQ